MARQVGGTTGQARQALDTAAGLADCPGTRLALLDGELSLGQAAAITRAEPESPDAEAELLEVARSSDLAQLRDKAREHRQANTDVNDLHRQQLKARHFRHWRDPLGMVCFHRVLSLQKRESLSSTASSWQHNAPATQLSSKTAASARRFSRPMLPTPSLRWRLAKGLRRASARADLVIVCDVLAWRRGAHAHPW